MGHAHRPNTLLGQTTLKSKIVSLFRRYVVPRRELDLAIAHRNAMRSHFSELQKLYLELESKMMSQTGYAVADVDVNIVSVDVPAFPHDDPFCWKIQCRVSREYAVALRNNVAPDLLPYIAENFKRTILEKLRARWNVACPRRELASTQSVFPTQE